MAIPEPAISYIPGTVGRLLIASFEVPNPRAVVLLVHGATYSGPTAYGFALPGEHSLMSWFASQGVSSYTFAIRGYGESDAPEDGFTVSTEAAMEDLTTVSDWLAAEKGITRCHVLGWSWGSRTSGRWAARFSDRVDRLVLFAGALYAGGPPREVPTEGFKTNTAESVAARLETAFTDPELVKELGAHVEQNEPRSPTGVFADLATDRTAVDPAAITRPTLLIYGSADGIYQPQKVADFFIKLPTADKALIVIPDAGHFLHMQYPKQRFFDVVTDFLLAETPSQ